MRVSILRSFPHSRDGVTILDAVAGTEEEIADALVPGLEAAGFVARPVTLATPATAGGRVDTEEAPTVLNANRTVRAKGRR